MTRVRKGVDEPNDDSQGVGFNMPIAEKAPRNRVVAPAEDSMDVPGSMASNTDMGSEATQSPTQTQESVGGKAKRKDKGRKRPKVWDAKKEESLIEMMRERVFMYDMEDAGYHNRTKKLAAKAYIAKELGVTGM